MKQTPKARIRGDQRIVVSALGAGVLFFLASAGAAQGPPSDLARQHLQSGIQFYEQGRYNQALNDFQIIVTSMAGTEYADDALLWIGRYHLEVEEDFDAAKESFESVIRNHPAGDAAPGAYYYVGETLFRADRTGGAIDDALANFQRVFLYPGNPWIPAALYATGAALERQGKFQEAVDAYYRVIVDHPRSDWAKNARLGVGRSFVRQGQPLEAMAELQEVRNRHPDAEEAEIALDWLTLLFRFYGAPMLGKSVSFRRDAGFEGSLRQDFKDVKAVRVSEAGIHVLERGRKRVVTFDRDGKLAGTTGAVDPYGLFVDARGKLLVTSEKGLVLDGQPQVFRVPSDKGPEQLEKLRWVVRDRLGDWFVYDDDEKKVLRFDPDGEPIGPFPDNLRREVLAMEVDPRGNLVLLEKRDRAVLVIGPAGRTVAKIETERGPRELKKAVDIALDPAGYLYILDEDEGRIAVYDASYAFVTMLDRSNLGQRALEKPTTLDVDASGDLYVYDEKAKTVVRLH